MPTGGYCAKSALYGSKITNRPYLAAVGEVASATSEPSGQNLQNHAASSLSSSEYPADRCNDVQTRRQVAVHPRLFRIEFPRRWTYTQTGSCSWLLEKMNLPARAVPVRQQPQVRATCQRRPAASHLKRGHRELHQGSSRGIDAVRLARRVRHAVVDVSHWEDAGIAWKPSSARSILKGPTGFCSDRETWRAVPANCPAASLFEQRCGPAGIFAEAAAGHRVNQAVFQTVAGDFVTAFGDAANQSRVPLRYPAKNKKCSFSLCRVKQIEQFFGIGSRRGWRECPTHPI